MGDSGAEGLPKGIRLLPPRVAERIAAGEVIDRPAAVVKELVENALDAGAGEVRVEARGGGLRLIRVSDDGHGIPADEVELAFQRHATSKLRELDDLERIDSFGFRGEALASVAAVAEVTIVSAVEGAAAVSCTYRAGRPLERVAASRTRGTTVTVRDLFSALPARLKFMRGARAEAGQIGAVLRRFALARPDLRFQLLLEGHTAFRHDGGGEREAFAAVFGDEAAAGALPVDLASGKVRVHGLLGGRGVTRANRGQIALFVNGRYVRARQLLAAIESGYRRFLPRNRHTAGAVFVKLPPSDVDINIHPAKLDVRVYQEGAVCAMISQAVAAAFGRHASVLSGRAELALSGTQARLSGLPRRVGEERAAFGWGEGVTLPQGELLPALRLVGQLRNALIVAEGEQGFFLIDQHRAHEQILFEYSERGAREGGQSLAEPAVFELPAAAAERLSDRLGALAALGFVCETFGARRFVLRSLPSALADENDPALAGTLPTAELPTLLGEAAVMDDDWRRQFLAAVACRSAIRKGRPLTPEQARDLMTRLGAARSPAMCPHGSPVLLYLPEGFLQRQFDW
ncbi:MAG TPA: DNA mismatch repair endonuclease MutL [Dehalococcoidia bacterium]|nr:DNA mismatch repair endonuclease MutL [Dehalococcoidia bacterium]